VRYPAKCRDYEAPAQYAKALKAPEKNNALFLQNAKELIEGGVQEFRLQLHAPSLALACGNHRTRHRVCVLGGGVDQEHRTMCSRIALSHVLLDDV
jgi:hypothetical protein